MKTICFTARVISLTCYYAAIFGALLLLATLAFYGGLVALEHLIGEAAIPTVMQIMTGLLLLLCALRAAYLEARARH